MKDKVPQAPVRIETSKNGKPLFIFNFHSNKKNKYSPTGIPCRVSKELKKSNG